MKKSLLFLAVFAVFQQSTIKAETNPFWVLAGILLGSKMAHSTVAETFKEGPLTWQTAANAGVLASAAAALTFLIPPNRSDFKNAVFYSAITGGLTTVYNETQIKKVAKEAARNAVAEERRRAQRR